MFDYLQGRLVSKSPTEAVIAVGGTGYRLTIPLSTYDALPDDGEVKLLVYMHVREDILRLYGFANEDDRRVFTSLLGVQGIGPSTALSILNSVPVNEFRSAVAREDLATVSRAKGIGKKTAQRIVIDLKREMEKQMSEPSLGGEGVPLGVGITSDAVAAMLALGYKRSAAEQAVDGALKRLGANAALEDVIRQALQGN